MCQTRSEELLIDSAKEHFSQMEHWLKLEAEADAARAAERRKSQQGRAAEKSGETLLDMVVSDVDPGLGGSYLIRLIKRNRELALPWNRLRVGSPVRISSHDGSDEQSWQGVVAQRRSAEIQIACHAVPDDEPLRVDLSSDEITRKRIINAFRTTEQARGRLAELRDILVGQGEPRFSAMSAESKEPRLEANTSLNASQLEAVQWAMAAEDLAIIHGPPGTGKTTTIVELVIQAVAQGEKVLVCAPSNTAVDHVVSKLYQRQQDVVRLGHPARVAKDVQSRTLDALVAEHDHSRVIREMLTEADQLTRRSERHTRARPAPGAKQEMRRQARQLRQDVRKLERQAVAHVLAKTPIVCATTTLDLGLIEDQQFDLVVIDEACQGTEPGCWIPITRANRLVLAGDHFQLPPVVLSPQAAKEGLAVSMMERLVAVHGPKVVRRLNVQYRMHEQIMTFSSNRFYDSGLQSDPSVANHTLADLAYIQGHDGIERAVDFFDTAGADWTEQQEAGEASWHNSLEAEFVLDRVEDLHQSGLPLQHMAIIAPYAAQVRYLRDRAAARLGFDHHLEIDTVDGFQGREKEAILISLVRSNDVGNIGFLADTRRMNVALTRARRKLIVVGDSATIGGHDFYRDLLSYFESVDGYRSIWEFQQ